MLGFDIAYMRAKSDHYSFSHSEDMVGALKNLNGSCDQTTPLSGMVGKHLLGSTYLSNLKSLSLPTTKIQTAIQNRKNGVVWGS